jgi:hypothetical protein
VVGVEMGYDQIRDAVEINSCLAQPDDRIADTIDQNGSFLA